MVSLRFDRIEEFIDWQPLQPEATGGVMEVRSG